MDLIVWRKTLDWFFTHAVLGKMLRDYAWLILSRARLFNILITIFILYVNFIFTINNLDAVLAFMVIGFLKALKVWFQCVRGLFSRYIFFVRYELKAWSYDWVPVQIN